MAALAEPGPDQGANRGANPGLDRAEARALRARLWRSERRRQLRAFGLVAPLALFLAVVFVLPIVQMLGAAWHDRSVADAMPRTAAAIASWDRDGPPSEEVYAAIAADLIAGRQTRALALPAQRLNQELTGFRTVIFGTARALPDLGADAPPEGWRDTLTGIDDRWADTAHLVVLQRAARPWTSYYMLHALDMERGLDDRIARQPPDERLFVQLALRTLGIAATVTVVCAVMGFPLAYLLATVSGGVRAVLLVMVLLPFWTSLLVRTAAWIVMLQSEGLVNSALMWTGAIGEPLRLIYNRFGVIAVMSQVLLPFMVLPLYAVMQGISPWYMRAAQSLGAPFATAFRRVYLPQTMPGLAAGTLLVFMLSIGYYITPALVGGRGDQMLSYFIAFYATETANWGLAAALGTMLTGIVAVLFVLYSRVFGTRELSVG
ncbi:ABC transporter permease [Rhodobaculum claviforme]|uniref:Polyamine ABC transporter substrate-binding protein n=1 Tax=Rhodobaculum claviforme TaxID=1549854 RepID=A0A934WIC1_9RHOB|nr:ABC transporter permease [Rhodobaculum claviforme]MBK5926686.1 polyamine ABC transporter substrate-binding protein [Rhodobaculum claviforme]